MSLRRRYRPVLPAFLGRDARAVTASAVILVLGLVASCGKTATDDPSDAGSDTSFAATSATGNDTGNGGNGTGTGGNGTGNGSNDTGNGSNDTRNGGNGTGTGGNGNGGNGNGGNQNGGSGGSSDRGVAWVPFGPQDPTFPTPTWPLYNAFASGDCSLLADALPANDIGDYGRLMLAICQAAVDGQPDGWETAESLAGADPGSLGNDCVAPLVEGAVGRALAWHDANPDLSPQVKLQRTGSQTACGAQSASENAGNSGDDGATDGSGATEDGSNSGDSGDTTGTSPSGAGDDASATP